MAMLKRMRVPTKADNMNHSSARPQQRCIHLHSQNDFKDRLGVPKHLMSFCNSSLPAAGETGNASVWF
jgi:hypothetical protein